MIMIRIRRKMLGMMMKIERMVIMNIMGKKMRRVMMNMILRRMIEDYENDDD